jgi:hypothetical protein
MEVWCVKTGDIPDLLLAHQNGERNEATQRVNESGNLNLNPEFRKPGGVAK